jgi:hypothetical protein
MLFEAALLLHYLIYCCCTQCMSGAAAGGTCFNNGQRLAMVSSLQSSESRFLSMHLHWHAMPLCVAGYPVLEANAVLLPGSRQVA